MTMNASIPITPEARLAIEAGIKKALSGMDKTAGDARAKAAPDQSIDEMVINLTLTVSGLSIGHDTDKTPTCSIPLLPTVALLIKRMGFQRDKAMETLQGVMKEALEIGGDKAATDALLSEMGVAEAMQTIQEEVIATLPRSPVKKTVKVKGADLTVTGVATK